MIGSRIQHVPEPTKTLLRKGDLVRVITGRESGKQGKILRLSRIKNIVWIEQLNLIKKHTKSNPKHPQGGIIEREGGLAISNVMIVCPNCERPARLGVKRLSDGERLRICRRCGESLDKV